MIRKRRTRSKVIGLLRTAGTSGDLSSCVDSGDEAPLQLAAVQLSHCVWGLHEWGPRGSDPTAGEVTAADPVPIEMVSALS